MKKPNEKKRILQKHQDPDRLPAPPGRLLPEGMFPEADGAYMKGAYMKREND